jgi:hypothetical protein
MTTGQRRDGDQFSAPVRHHPYELGPNAVVVFGRLGVDLAGLQHGGATTARPLLRFCMDWTEQQHHLAGRLGSAVLDALIGNGQVVRSTGRAVRVTRAGISTLERGLGVPCGLYGGTENPSTAAPRR